MNTATGLVECRVPTYSRPKLLRRALLSLQRQSFGDWVAIVLDDSPNAEGRTVVAELGDARISWRQNSRQLGATANLDQAFSAQPLLGGRCAFVLEDDNAIGPEYIATGLRRLERGDIRVLSFNQRCVHLAPDGSETWVGLLRPETAEEEQWDRDRLLLNGFLGLSLPNGGYFWDLDAGLDLTVGPGVVESQLQECIRQTLVPPPVTLMPHAFSLWSMLPPTQVRRQLVGNRRLAANLNQLSAAIVEELGPARLRQLVAAAKAPSLAARMEHIMSDLSLISSPCRRWFALHPLAALRCKLRFHLYRDSLGNALAPISSQHAKTICSQAAP